MSLIDRKRVVLRAVLVSLVAVACGTPAVSLRAQASTGGTVRVRTRCVACATTARDSARTRHERLLLKIDSLRYEFDHERLSDAKRERLADEMNRTVIALQSSLAELERGRFTAPEAARVEQEMARAMAAPRMSEPAIAIAIARRYMTRGYLGVTFDGPSMKTNKGNEVIVRFLDYPRISLVEPSSPAERAGIEEGDTLLAFNGDDVRDRAISLTKLLVPDQRIIMRVRRDGDAKDFRVKIDSSPDYMISRAATAPMAVVPPMAMGPRELPPRGTMPGMPPMAMAPGASVWVFSEGVGGAKVESITEGLGNALGVTSGVLVLKVAPGTPAYKAGLRDGDVILRAAGNAVRSVRELRALADGDRDEGVKLVIQRDHKQREITLRW